MSLFLLTYCLKEQVVFTEICINYEDHYYLLLNLNKTIYFDNEKYNNQLLLIVTVTIVHA